ncbi:TPA: adhesion protein, partial [Streptococcus agalactiae]
MKKVFFLMAMVVSLVMIAGCDKSANPKQPTQGMSVVTS